MLIPVLATDIADAAVWTDARDRTDDRPSRHRVLQHPATGEDSSEEVLQMQAPHTSAQGPDRAAHLEGIVRQRLLRAPAHTVTTGMDMDACR